MFCKKGVPKNSSKFTGKHLCQGLFFNEVAWSCNFIKKRLWHRCFPVNFDKFLRTPFLQNTSGWLLLWLVIHYSFLTVKGGYSFSSVNLKLWSPGNSLFIFFGEGERALLGDGVLFDDTARPLCWYVKVSYKNKCKNCYIISPFFPDNSFSNPWKRLKTVSLSVFSARGEGGGGSGGG